MKFKETNQICSPLKISRSINAESACDRNNKGMYSYFYESIVTRKEIVWKRRNFFCLCYVLTLTSAQSFRKGTKSSGNFNNISLNIKFWKKDHLSLDYISKYPKALLNEVVMNNANCFIFRCSSSKKKIWCSYCLKVPQNQRDDEWNSKRRKDTSRESPKNISICEIHYCKDNL